VITKKKQYRKVDTGRRQHSHCVADARERDKGRKGGEHVLIEDSISCKRGTETRHDGAIEGDWPKAGGERAIGERSARQLEKIFSLAYINQNTKTQLQKSKAWPDLAGSRPGTLDKNQIDSISSHSNMTESPTRRLVDETVPAGKEACKNR